MPLLTPGRIDKERNKGGKKMRKERKGGTEVRVLKYISNVRK